jgi:hypothetical protein
LASSSMFWLEKKYLNGLVYKEQDITRIQNQHDNP